MEKINISDISKMDGHQFEELVGELFIKIGFRIEKGKKTADGGIDIIAYSSELITGGKYIIQCKRHDAPISEHVVRDLYGVVTDQKANKGIVITNSDFSSAAIKFAEGKPLELIDGQKLINLISKYLGAAEQLEEKSITSNQEFLLKSLITIVDDLKNQYNAIKVGLKFKEHSKISNLKEYHSYVKGEQFNLINDFLKNLSKLLNVFANLSNLSSKSKSEDEKMNIMSHIQQHIKGTYNFMKNFLDKWEAFYFTESPDEAINLKNLVLELYDSIFLKLFSISPLIKEGLDNAEQYAKENKIFNMNLDFNSENIMNNVELVKKELDMLFYKYFAWG